MCYGERIGVAHDARQLLRPAVTPQRRAYRNGNLIISHLPEECKNLQKITQQLIASDTLSPGISRTLILRELGIFISSH
jgi:hypothetical protein